MTKETKTKKVKPKDDRYRSRRFDILVQVGECKFPIRAGDALDALDKEYGR